MLTVNVAILLWKELYLLQYILHSFFWTSFCCLQRIAINDKHDLFFLNFRIDTIHTLMFTFDIIHLNSISRISSATFSEKLSSNTSFTSIGFVEYDDCTTMYILNENEIPNEYEHWTLNIPSGSFNRIYPKSTTVWFDEFCRKDHVYTWWWQRRHHSQWGLPSDSNLYIYIVNDLSKKKNRLCELTLFAVGSIAKYRYCCWMLVCFVLFSLSLALSGVYIVRNV